MLQFAAVVMEVALDFKLQVITDIKLTFLTFVSKEQKSINYGWLGNESKQPFKIDFSTSRVS